MHSFRRTLIAAPLAAAAFAAPASAQTYCVHQAGSCPAGAVDKGAALQQALTDAAAAVGPDTVTIAAGTYVAPAGGFVANSPDPLTMVGAGTSTILTGSTTPIIDDGDSHLSSVAIQTDSAAGSTGLVGLNAAQIDHVTVTGGGFQSHGAFLSGAAVLQDSTITMDAGGVAVAASASGGVAPTVQDDRLTASNGIEIQGSGTVAATTVRRSVITAATGINVNGANAVVESSIIRLVGTNVATAVDCNAAGSGSLSLDHVTVLASGGEGVEVECVMAGRTASAGVANTALRGVGHAVSVSQSGGGTASVNLGYSDADLAGTQLAGGATLNQGPGVIHPADPGFASATDPHLLAASPLVDAGRPGASLEALDLDGLARLSGPTQDIGAYEYQVPVPPTGGGGGGGAPADAAKSATADSSAGPADPAVSAVGSAGPVAAPIGQPELPSSAQLDRMLREAAHSADRASYAVRGPAGSLTVTWKRGSTMLATGSMRRDAVGAYRVAIRLTDAGRRALAHHRAVRVALDARFVSGAGSVRAGRRATVRLTHSA